ncbi:helix-turn-helix domain-containing protein [Magnetospirillum aberrantis]|uniref:Helix-turn-helix transcriptional regulator n=1 Tax=Magnetospirillum aberrantis SpK TaxID=908842 RepID=A0A7C9QU39_9PROT|nr:helix-turn-helix transcriptional regulator [Magnetospirillum aberrantis]NFV80698.1 helix-turn-helix transcriptional regulator [Magnetospirillum aberrantis SpK]
MEQTYAERLRAIRERLRMNQTEFGEFFCGLAQNRISELENCTDDRAFPRKHIPVIERWEEHFRQLQVPRRFRDRIFTPYTPGYIGMFAVAVVFLGVAILMTTRIVADAWDIPRTLEEQSTPKFRSGLEKAYEKFSVRQENTRFTCLEIYHLSGLFKVNSDELIRDTNLRTVWGIRCPKFVMALPIDGEPENSAEH